MRFSLLFVSLFFCSNGFAVDSSRCLNALHGVGKLGYYKHLGTSHDYLFETGPGAEKTLKIYTQKGVATLNTDTLSCATEAKPNLQTEKVQSILKLNADNLDSKKQGEAVNPQSLMTPAEVDTVLFGCASVQDEKIYAQLQRLVPFSEKYKKTGLTAFKGKGLPTRE